MKYEKSCGAIVLNGSEILVIQQLEGHWGFPKGHVEGNETEVETAIREIKEETNLDVVIKENFRYVERYSPKEGVEKEVVYFVAEKIGGNEKVQAEELQNFKWLNYEDAMKKLTYKNSKETLKNAWKDLANNN
ncbi:MAG: NUDIX domain-containing protein [Clostridiales bacterium]|nr:NUDIX domain-containing protein [Clostridiales bacterium]